MTLQRQQQSLDLYANLLHESFIELRTEMTNYVRL